MPRRAVPFVPGAYYHVYNRGNNRGAIFFEPENYIYFLKGIKQYLMPVVDILAYCLMPTHYHLLVRVRPQISEDSKTAESSQEVSRAMQKFLISYTKAVNKRFSRVGALFQGAFQARPILDARHLLHVCRYIHANPVKDGLVTEPGKWPYSNYLEWLGERGGTLVDHEFIGAQFPAPEAYKDFVNDYIQSRKMPEDVVKYLDALEG